MTPDRFVALQDLIAQAMHDNAASHNPKLRGKPVTRRAVKVAGIAMDTLDGAGVFDETTELREVLGDLIDPDPCWFDHHGYCQAHGWLTDGECPQARAKRLVTP